MRLAAGLIAGRRLDWRLKMLNFTKMKTAG
jgi:hypothetical protein